MLEMFMQPYIVRPKAVVLLRNLFGRSAQSHGVEMNMAVGDGARRYLSRCLATYRISPFTILCEVYGWRRSRSQVQSSKGLDMPRSTAARAALLRLGLPRFVDESARCEFFALEVL